MEPAEFIERAALVSLHKYIPDALRLQLGLTLINEEAGTFSLAKALPSSAIVINRGLGLNTTAKEFPSLIAEAIESYKLNNISRYFLQFCQPSANELEHLKNLGFCRARAWQKFQLSAAEFRPQSHSLKVVKIEKNNLDCAKIICAAFDLGEQAVPWLELLPSLPNWHVFAVEIDDQIVACAGLYMQEGNAWLDFAATAPQYRNQGCQRALIQSRLNFMLDHDCKDAFTCTGVAIRNDPQHSYHNIIQSGFKPSYIRDNFTLA